jgi:hypothetical protein
VKLAAQSVSGGHVSGRTTGKAERAGDLLLYEGGPMPDSSGLLILGCGVGVDSEDWRISFLPRQLTVVFIFIHAFLHSFENC